MCGMRCERLAVLNRMFMENNHLSKHMKEMINQALMLSECDTSGGGRSIKQGIYSKCLRDSKKPVGME